MPLDSQSKQLLENIKKTGVPPIYTIPVNEGRKRMENDFIHPENWEDIFQIENLKIPCTWGQLGIRVYKSNNEKELPIFIYYHGGGWTLNNLETHESVCRMFANRAKCVVVSVDYRLAPENKFPAALEDAYTTLQWVYDNAEFINGDKNRITVGGDSSGGNLAAAISILSRDRNGPNIIFQVLVYPVTDYYEPGTKSYEDYAKGYYLDRESMIWFWNNYLKEGEDVDNPYICPLRTSNLSNLPNAFILTAEFDPLRDEAEIYAEKLKDAGSNVIIKRYEGVMHNFLLQCNMLDKGIEAINDICEKLKEVYENKDDKE